MNLNWFRKKNLPAIRGKTGGQDLIHGGWETLYGSITWKKSGEVWRTFTPRELEELYKIHAVIYSCVKKITSAVQEASLMCGIEEDDGFEKVENDITTLLEHPNDNMDYRSFMATLTANLLLSGESNIFEVRNRSQYIDALWPLPQSWVNRITDANGNLLYYEVRYGNTWLQVPVDDMTWLYFPDPGNPTRGCGPLQAALRDYQTDEERQNYLGEMLMNMKVASMILYQPEGWTLAQKDEARKQIHEKIGKGNRGGPLFLAGEGAKAEALTPLSDLDWPGLSALSETRICSCFGVPPITIGLRSGLDRATYSNAEQADRTFYRQTMVGIWNSIASGLTKGLLTDEGEEGLILKFDLSNIWQLQEDMNSTSERVTRLFTSGIMTRNEARQAMNLEPMPPVQGDVLALPMGLIEVPASPEAKRAMMAATSHSEATPWEPEEETPEAEEETEEEVA